MPRRSRARDIDVGDRVLARGELSDDKAPLAASTLVIMTKADIAKKQQADQAEWQKRGVSGLVTAVDAEARRSDHQHSARGRPRSRCIIVANAQDLGAAGTLRIR